jgi:hypothetical protein
VRGAYQLLADRVRCGRGSEFALERFEVLARFISEHREQRRGDRLAVDDDFLFLCARCGAGRCRLGSFAAFESLGDRQHAARIGLRLAGTQTCDPVDEHAVSQIDQGVQVGRGAALVLQPQV